MRLKKSFISIGAALLCAAVMLSLGACGKKSGEKQTCEGTLRVAVMNTMDSLNPFKAEGSPADDVFLLCYDSLWRLDENYEPVGCLAESWDLSTDKLTWTIRLRHGVYFSDEAHTELTSADVKFTFELMKKYSSRYADYLDGVVSIVCPDSYTVVITTEYLKGDMLYNLIPILPRTYWSAYEENPLSFENAELIGSGPFIYDAEQSGSGTVTLRANTDYFNGSPYVESVVFQTLKNASVAANALSTGEVDACLGLTDAQMMTLSSITAVELIQSQTPAGGCCVLGFNTTRGGLDDENVRKAIEYCVNREKIFAMVFGASGVSGSVFFAPGTDYYQSSVEVREFSKEQAILLLESHGYSDYDGDGVRESQDGQVELSFTLYTSAEDEWAPTVVTILTGDLEEIGISVTWVALEEGQSLSGTCKQGGNWGMYIAQAETDNNPVITAQTFYSGAKHVTGWSDEDYDAVYQQMCRQLEESEAISLARELQTKVYDACPWVVLAYPVSFQAIRSDLWTGYADCMTASGGLFDTGTYQTYMNVRLNTENEAVG